MNMDYALRHHKYAIWQGKDGAWFTTLPDPTKERGVRQIKRRNRHDLDIAIYDWYNGFETNNKDDALRDYSNKLESEKLKNDFSSYKEINIWDIKSGTYLISPIGNVYSMASKKWLKPQINDVTKTYPGQYYVQLYTNEGKMHRFSVARLVLAMYKGLPPNDMEDPTVDHIDHMPLNNYYENLRWVERGINSSSRPNRGIGEMNSRAKLSQNDVIKICNLLVNKSKTVDELAQMYSVSTRTINNIKAKKSWQYITKWFDF